MLSSAPLTFIAVFILSFPIFFVLFLGLLLAADSIKHWWRSR